ncbi:MAG: hypothetical protein AAGF12_28305 [Myxococcota bacterium]
MPLAPCPGCRRHVFQGLPCPFCAASLPLVGGMLLVATGCSDSTAVPVYGGPPPEDMPPWEEMRPAEVEGDEQGSSDTDEEDPDDGADVDENGEIDEASEQDMNPEGESE